jgi:hypothetical protein
MDKAITMPVCEGLKGQASFAFPLTVNTPVLILPVTNPQKAGQLQKEANFDERTTGEI